MSITYTVYADNNEIKTFKQFKRAVILALKLRYSHKSVFVLDSLRNKYNYSR